LPYRAPPGAAWRAKLKSEHSITIGGPAFGSPEALERLPHDQSTPGEASAHVTIEDGRRTRLRVEIPGEIHAQIAQLVESVTSADEFVDRLQNDNPFFRYDVAITILGTEPLKEDETKAAAGQSTP
jgi:hypothetical protein